MEPLTPIVGLLAAGAGITVWLGVRLARMASRLEARERAHEASETRYRLVARATNDVIWDLDVERGHAIWSEAVSTVFGYRTEEVSGAIEWWHERIHPDERDRVAASLDAAIAGGETVWTEEYRFRRADGRYATVLDRGYVARDREGRAVRVIGAMLDLTERNRAERALSERERQLRAIFDGALEPILVADDQGRYVDANPAALAVLGYDREALLARRVEDIVPPEHRAATSESWRRFLEAGEASGEIELVAADARRLIVEFRARAHVTPGRHLSVLRDVTERRRLEAALRHAQKLEAVGRLAGGIAHDFNNILTAITGHSDLLLAARTLGDGHRRDIEAIRMAAERAAALIRRLLAFSRRQVLTLRTIDLVAVVRGMEEMLRRLIGEDVRLELRLGGEPIAVRADGGQLEQVLMNLVVNARDAMPGGGEIVVEARVVVLSEADVRDWVGRPAGPYARLSVADTGIGMDAGTMAHLFEPFFTTKPSGEGTGLGLATVYGIVEQSGGHVDVRSVPGRGSTFDVFLPLAGEAPEAQAAGDAGVGPRGSGTILLVEDDPMVGSLARRLLEANGYTVLAAASADEARALARDYQGPLDLLLSDVVMPGGSGPRLAADLTAARPGLKVLFMSGYTDIPEAFEGRGIGGPLLEKPFTAAALYQWVREAMDGEAPRP